jgi:hypothetical protein
VKEKRKGPIGRAAGIAEGLAATVRRMQREREPRVLVYDETGYARLVQPDGRGYERLRETAERMVALVDEAETAAKAKPRRAVATAEPDTGAEDGPKPRRAARAKPAADAKKGPRQTKTAKPKKAKAKPRQGKAAAAKPRRARPTEATADGGGKPRGARRAPRKEDA